MTDSASPIGALARRIAEAKTHSGLTFQEIADELRGRDPGLRTTKSIVSNWCNQGVVPEGRALILLPEVFDVDGHWLLTGGGTMLRQDPDEEANAFREIARIVEGVRERPPTSEDVSSRDRAIRRHHQAQAHREDSPREKGA